MSERKRPVVDDKRDLVLRGDHGTILVDLQGRGAVLINLGVVRSGRDEWNFTRLPRREVKRLIALLTKPVTP